jgi:thiamine biosynthesis protein ThiS
MYGCIDYGGFPKKGNSQHMKLIINGKEIDNNDYKNVAEVITSTFSNIEGIIVELNGNIVRKNQWHEQLLQENDKIEVIQFVGGG